MFENHKCCVYNFTIRLKSRMRRKNRKHFRRVIYRQKKYLVRLLMCWFIVWIWSCLDLFMIEKASVRICFAVAVMWCKEIWDSHVICLSIGLSIFPSSQLFTQFQSPRSHPREPAQSRTHWTSLIINSVSSKSVSHGTCRSRSHWKSQSHNCTIELCRWHQWTPKTMIAFPNIRYVFPLSS